MKLPSLKTEDFLSLPSTSPDTIPLLSFNHLETQVATETVELLPKNDFVLTDLY